MAKDVKFSTTDGSFKLRACGVVCVNNKYLVKKSSNGGFWNFPAGHVEIGENTDTAVLREVLEETGFEVKIEKLLAIVQNFFPDQNGKPFHEIGYYYLLSPTTEIATEDFTREENDKGVIKQHEFKFVTLQEFASIGVRPPHLVSVLENNLQNQHIIVHSKD